MEIFDEKSAGGVLEPLRHSEDYGQPAGGGTGMVWFGVPVGVTNVT